MRRWKQGDDSGRLGLADNIPEAVELLARLEDVLFHGLKVSVLVVAAGANPWIIE
jgi:hypothetical protein